MPQPMISVEHLSKAYRLGLKEEMPDTFVGAFTGWLKAPLRNWKRLKSLNTFDEPVAQAGTAVQEPGGSASNGVGEHVGTNGEPDDLLWALRDVSFEVNEGEVVGIIGRNGAGKSTLLKILSRITEPTHGRAVIRGRVSSLLEVGTGFHPELTGRENIYMNGTILGMRKKEIDKKFDEIVDFSGVEKFLDTPIKRYSSGMKVRLAFAVAAHLEPEILIIDEVLAVGDSEFQKKCLGKMQDVATKGRTVLFVSHNMAAVENLCHRCILLSTGTVEQISSAQDVVHVYLSSGSKGPSCSLEETRAPQMLPVIQSVRLIDSSGRLTTAVASGGALCVEINYASQEKIFGPRFGILVESLRGESLFLLQTGIQSEALGEIPQAGRLRCQIPQIPLVPGSYLLTIGCSSRGEQLDLLRRAIRLDVVAKDVHGTGRLPSASHGPFVVVAGWELASHDGPFPEAALP